jgi:hypothetical protein
MVNQNSQIGSATAPRGPGGSHDAEDAWRGRKIYEELCSLIEDMLQFDFGIKARLTLDMIKYDLPHILDRRSKAFEEPRDTPNLLPVPNADASYKMRDRRHTIDHLITEVIPPLTDLAAGRAPADPMKFVMTALRLMQELEQNFNTPEIATD